MPPQRILAINKRFNLFCCNHGCKINKRWIAAGCISEYCCNLEIIPNLCGKKNRMQFDQKAIKKNVLNFVSVFAGAMLLCGQAFFNGFPFVYPDTGTYIGAGFENYIPRDRPIAYSFFIRHFSLAETLWLPVIVQSLILSWLIFLFFKNLAKTKQVYAFHLLTIAVLSICTGVGLISGQLIPDIFSPVLVLSGMLLLFGKDISRGSWILLLCIFAFSIATHFSHFPLIAGLILFAVLIHFLKRKKENSPWQFKRIRSVFMGFTAAILLTITINFSISGKFSFSPEGSHIFVVNRLINCRIMGDYLEKNCEKKHWSLCGYGNLVNYDFIWNQESPVYKKYGTGFDSWLKAKPEYDSIISDVFSHKEYLGRFAWCSFRDASVQLVTFHSGCCGPQLKNSAPWNSIQWHFPKSEQAYLNSRQNQSQKDFTVLNLLQIILVAFSLISILTMMILPKLRKSVPPGLQAAFTWLCFSVLINAFTVVTFAMIDERFEARMIWLFPLFLAVLISNETVRKQFLSFFKKG